eukprot:240893-Pyramimonas_sp.AAC.1
MRHLVVARSSPPPSQPAWITLSKSRSRPNRRCASRGYRRCPLVPGPCRHHKQSCDAALRSVKSVCCVGKPPATAVASLPAEDPFPSVRSSFKC